MEEYFYHTSGIRLSDAINQIQLEPVLDHDQQSMRDTVYNRQRKVYTIIFNYDPAFPGGQYVFYSSDCDIYIDRTKFWLKDVTDKMRHVFLIDNCLLSIAGLDSSGGRI